MRKYGALMTPGSAIRLAIDCATLPGLSTSMYYIVCMRSNGFGYTGHMHSLVRIVYEGTKYPYPFK